MGDDFIHNTWKSLLVVTIWSVSRKRKIASSLRKVKKLFAFLKSLLYPFVASEQKSGKGFISNEMIVEILSHNEDNGLSTI